MNRMTTRERDALIIGAGFAGLYQLHLLRDRLGQDVEVVEAAAGVGGTWWWNRYPGARCDSESHSYQYYFSRELHESWTWSERYPGQEEIRAYLNHAADFFDLRRDITLSTRVTAALWDEGSARWLVTLDDGQQIRTRYLIAAIGCLSTANVPAIEGLEQFGGDWHHTGHWPHAGVDFTGKRVGQIGTGSTGIQAAPVIAAEAAHLTVFQRTANYSVPARNAPLDESFKDWVATSYDELRALTRSTPNGHPFRISETCAFDVGAAERDEIYAKSWDVGGLRFRAAFQDLIVNKAANDTAADYIKGRIRNVVQDAEKAEILTAIDHPFAAKRPPIDSAYFETFNRGNVDLVNLLDTPIVRITEDGIQTTGGDVPLDIIVFATGFDAMTGPLLAIDITGAGGLTMEQAWADGPATYLGLQIAGFPNLFTVTGPGSPSVLSNMPVSIEQHVEWIADCIAHLEKAGATKIEPTSAAVADWVAHVNAAANATLLPTVKHSWYLGANIPGKPRVFMPYAGGLTKYRAICDEVAAEGYKGFQIDGISAAHLVKAAASVSTDGV